MSLQLSQVATGASPTPTSNTAEAQLDYEKHEEGSRPTILLTCEVPQFITTINPALFGFDDAIFPSGLGALRGAALRNFKLLNLAGSYTPIPTRNFEPKKGDLNTGPLDADLKECSHLGLKPDLVLGELLGIPWIWHGDVWSTASDEQVQECCKYVGDILQHTNVNGLFYTPEVGLIEMSEPFFNDEKERSAYIKIAAALADYVHKHFEQVKVGISVSEDLAPFYTRVTRSPLDFISWHCRELTLDKMFDTLNMLESSKSVLTPGRSMPILISECDCPLPGIAKFDYIMRRTFGTLERPSLVGLMQYRLDQFSQDGYVTGALWCGTGPGKDKIGLPMHNVYDAYLMFHSLRGCAMVCGLSASDGKQSALLKHVHAAAVTNSRQANLVIYRDCDPGCTDGSDRKSYSSASVDVHMGFYPCSVTRRMRIWQSRGDGYAVHPSLQIAPGESSKDFTVSLQPHTAVSVVIEPEPSQAQPMPSVPEAPL